MNKPRSIKGRVFWIIVAIFALFVVFVSDHSLIRYWRYQSEERALRREIEAFRDSIDHYEQAIKEVSVGGSELERYAREKLMMKRENEDVYIIK